MRSYLNNRFLLFCVFVFIIHFFQIVYFNLSKFQVYYSEPYLKERFEHSQWNLPLSQRGIGDDALFSYVGLNLVSGGDPSNINPETPPLSKYLIGLSIKYLNTPAYYALAFGMLSLLVFYKVTKKISKNKELAVFATLLLFLDTLFFTQLWKAWSDIAQLFFLLGNVYFLLRITEKKNILLALLAGLFLGFFIVTKFPVLLPLILLIELVYFWRIKLKRVIPIYLIGIFWGIVIPYFKYFMDHSFTEFLSLQKYIVSFYSASGLEVHYGSLLQALLIGKFPDIASGHPVTITEWSILWTIFFILSIPSLIEAIKKRDYVVSGLGIFTFGSLIIFSLIPSYPRYLLLIIPFLYILGTLILNSFIKNTKVLYFIFFVLVIVSLLKAFFVLLPTPTAMVDTFSHSLSNQFLPDIYEENISEKSKLYLSREYFWKISTDALNKAEIKKIDIVEEKRSVSLFSSTGTIDVVMTYHTLRLGQFEERKTINLIKEGSEWKIDWDWGILLNGFSPHVLIENSTIVGRRGSIIIDTNQGELVLARDAPGFLILVNPDRMDTGREREMILSIQAASNKNHLEIQNAYLMNPFPNTYIPVASTFKELPEEERAKLLSYQGVRLDPFPSRLYSEAPNSIDPSSIKNNLFDERYTRIYSSTNYHGVEGPEKDYEDVLIGNDGGELVLKDGRSNITRVIIRKQVKNGKDVRLQL